MPIRSMTTGIRSWASAPRLNLRVYFRSRGVVRNCRRRCTGCDRRPAPVLTVTAHPSTARPTLSGRVAATRCVPARCARPRTDRIRIMPRSPPPEPWGRRARIDSGHVLQMLPEIHQDVHQRMANRARRRESPRVVAVRPYLSSAAEGPVHCPGKADGEARTPLESARPCSASAMR